MNSPLAFARRQQNDLQVLDIGFGRGHLNATRLPFPVGELDAGGLKGSLAGSFCIHRSHKLWI
jgi:hypothetical protein